jgi:hypothetical protein
MPPFQFRHSTTFESRRHSGDNPSHFTAILQLIIHHGLQLQLQRELATLITFPKETLVAAFGVAF